MREYIFRLWSKIENRYVDPSVLEVWNKSGVLCPLNLDGDEYTIEQYTELTDSKGARIFEGDILAENYTAEMAALGGDANVGDVYFESGAFLIRGGSTLFDLTYSVTPNIVDGYSVVGNINENPNYL